MKKFDLVVVGAGVVGLATAYQYLKRFPSKRVVVLEKEREVGAHQTSHNSGVVHSGIYYKPGSLKAKNCTEGKRLLEEFCARTGVPIRPISKVLVATDEQERAGLLAIYDRGQKNGVDCELISPEQLREIEPHVAGTAAIWVRKAAVIDFKAVANKLADEIRLSNGEVRCDSGVTRIDSKSDGLRIFTTNSEFDADFLVNAAGLHSDRVLEMTGVVSPSRIVPFRGEYYLLKKEKDFLCRGLIYPVPNPNFPFLGVHYTRGIDDKVECGPNAVLALAREGYSWSKIRPLDVIDSISFGGFWRFTKRYWREGVAEISRSFSKKTFVAALQRLIPEIQEGDLEKGGSGVRAQAMVKEGTLVDDFLWFDGPRSVHVLNAPSPAATSCLSIGNYIVDRVTTR